MVPQCPSNLTWGGMSGTSGLAETADGIVRVLDSLKKEFSLDTTRFYVTGLSLGGAGTYHLLAMKPNLFAAAVPCSAGGDVTAIQTIAKTPIWHHHGSLDGNPPGGRRMADALEGAGIKVVRFVSQAAITGPSLNDYSNRLKSGTKPEDLVFKNPSGAVTYDSLARAVDGGANYLYSELTGGDHRSGWMIAWHNPLLAKWLFSKTKEPAVVSIAYPNRPRHNPRKAAWLRALNTEATYSLDGRRLQTGHDLGNLGVNSKLRSEAARIITVPANGMGLNMAN